MDFGGADTEAPRQRVHRSGWVNCDNPPATSGKRHACSMDHRRELPSGPSGMPCLLEHGRDLLHRNAGSLLRLPILMRGARDRPRCPPRASVHPPDRVQFPTSFQQTGTGFVAFIIAAVASHLERDWMRPSPDDMNMRPATLDMKDDRTLVADKPKVTFQFVSRLEPALLVHRGGTAHIRADAGVIQSSARPSAQGDGSHFLQRRMQLAGRHARQRKDLCLLVLG